MKFGETSASSDFRDVDGPGSPTPSQLPFERILPVATAVVPLFLLGLAGWFTWLSAWQSAEADMRRASVAAAEYGQRAFESYSVAAGRVNDRLRGLSDVEIRNDERSLNLDLQRITGELSQSQLSFVIDRNGHPILSSSIYPVPRDASLADRDYFRVLSSPSAPEVYISQTFIGRFDGRLLFSVGRRRSETGNLDQADGFDGIVLISVSPNVLAGGLKRLLPTPADRMAFMRADGFGISTTSGLLTENRPLPQVDPASPFYEIVQAGAQSAVYVSTTAMPGSKSLLAMQRVEGFPIYAVSIRPASEVWAAWWTGITPLFGFGLPATLALFLLSLRVSRDQKRLTARNISLLQTNFLSSDRLLRAKRFGLVGTFEFDLRTGVSQRSPEYMSVHGRPAVPTLETHADWARRLHPDDRQRAETELSRALADASGETDYGQTYRIVTPSGEIRWIAARGEILRDATGRAIMLRGAHVDITPLRTAEMALAESDARLRLAQEAMGIGVWEWIGSTQPMQCSAQCLELLGYAGAAAPWARAVLARVHIEDRPRLAIALRQLKDTGMFKVDFRFHRDTPNKEAVWLAARAKKVISGENAGSRLIGIVYDVSDRKRAEELTTLMAHEVEHRAKNVLTIVSGLLRMTRAATAKDFAVVMEGRLNALSQTMGLLGKEGWRGAGLREIVANELAAFASSDLYVIEIDGPALLINVHAAQPLAMALHELATNAAKYGSLSLPGGKLKITWTVNEERLDISWEERDGPTINATPSRNGFGSRLIHSLFEAQLGGTIYKKWKTGGLFCEMSLPARCFTTTT